MPDVYPRPEYTPPIVYIVGVLAVVGIITLFLWGTSYFTSIPAH